MEAGRDMERADFAKFFAAVNDGRVPFKWQERLLDSVLEAGRWPDRIAAPTGAGKTSSIDVHVFAVALTASSGPRLPRRLSMVVGRRVLVDDQYQHALELAGALGRALSEPENDLIAEVAVKLAVLRWAEGTPRPANEPPLVTGRLCGGSVPSRAWRDEPAACSVLCGTPDMWGSRLLFRGYGTSGKAAPREAGLLSFDCAVMVDEAHLARQLLTTARQVSHLAGVAEQPIAGVPALQVVEVSATPAPGQQDSRQLASVDVKDEDLAEEVLAARLTRPKPLRLVPVKDWPSSRHLGKAAAVVAEEVMRMLPPRSGEDAVPHTVGCFVNTVPMAIAVASALRTRSLDGQPLGAVMVCGQARPADLTRLIRSHPGIFTTGGNPAIDVIVATQSLEVGVDLDLAGIVTELAAGSALAQRAGRANRLGKRPQAPVTVLMPAEPITDRTRSGPYSWEELQDAHAWISERAEDADGLAPWALQEHPPPPARQRRILYQRPELADAWHWARTSDDLAAEPELDLWLSDSLEDETSIGLVVRDALPQDPADAVEFVRDLPPTPWETFPVPYRTARSVLRELLFADRERHEAVPRPLVRVRGEDVGPLRLRTHADGTSAPDIRPGDFVVIDSSSRIFTHPGELVFSPQVVVPPRSEDDQDGLERPGRDAAEDALHQPDLRPGNLILRLEWSPNYQSIGGLPTRITRRILNEFADGFDERTERGHRDRLAGLLRGRPRNQITRDVEDMLDAVIGLLRGAVKHSDVILRETEDGQFRVVVADRRRASLDEDLRQVYTPGGEEAPPVLLDDHQKQVAERAALLGERLGVSGNLVEALRLAGLHHDDGKADPRFQSARLGADGSGPLLAKSDPRSTVRQVRERQAQGGLPSGWRHEQRSVADSWEVLHATAGADPLLAARLAGTSHGHGRSGFPLAASQLAGGHDSEQWRHRASALFDSGGWDGLIETTHIRYGVWGCAYLEALLRAADSQVSREGR